MHWKTRIYETAYKIANQFSQYDKILGVAIGGSIGRGVTWEHSDLELCIVVEEIISDIQYFNYIDELGVEIIQIRRADMYRFIESQHVQTSNVLLIPIQIYKCKIIYDPSGLLEKFKAEYDSLFFSEIVRRLKADEAVSQADVRLERAKILVTLGDYKTALAHLRLGLNDLLLGYYWSNGILPRSQNRTLHLLKQNSKIIGHNKLYNAFIQIFCLSKTTTFIKDRLSKAQSGINKISEANWGRNSSEFLMKAVDSHFEWGHHKSVVYVYKWCVHLLQCGDINSENKYDLQPGSESDEVNEFLDMNDISMEQVESFIQIYEEARNAL